jgi:hypothetical protein
LKQREGEREKTKRRKRGTRMTKLRILLIFTVLPRIPGHIERLPMLNTRAPSLASLKFRGTMTRWSP